MGAHPRRKAAAAARRHRELLDAAGEGARFRDAQVLLRWFTVERAARTGTVCRADRRGRSDGGLGDFRSCRAAALLPAARRQDRASARLGLVEHAADDFGELVLAVGLG